MAFDDSFALSDAVAFAEMGAPIAINGTQIVAIRQPNDTTSTAAGGGFARDDSAKFEISHADFTQYAVKVGVKVVQGAETWRVAAVRRRGGTVDLVCMSTSGQSGRGEF
jgi:hypothetical protein